MCASCKQWDMAPWRQMILAPSAPPVREVSKQWRSPLAGAVCMPGMPPPPRTHHPHSSILQ